MSTNFLSNESLHGPHHVHFIPLYIDCYISGASSPVFVSYLITLICLLLPLSIFIIYHGHQQRQQRGSSSSATTINHFDCFMHHVVIIELIYVLGCTVCCCGIYRLNLSMIRVGDLTFSITWYGETCFHVLTCLERYLAVVHPVTYLSMRNERGVRIRNITTGCIWLFCFIELLLVALQMSLFLDMCLLVLSLTVVSFCSLAVLWVLIRPGPGNNGSGRKGINKSKRKAFITIVAILGVLVVRFIFNFTWELVFSSEKLKGCLILSWCTWFNLPSSLVLPLLFLHRTRKQAYLKRISS